MKTLTYWNTVYACDFKPEARKLALELGAVAAFDLIELSNMTAATNPPDKRFTVDTTMDFVSNNQSKRTSPVHTKFRKLIRVILSLQSRDGCAQAQRCELPC